MEIRLRVASPDVGHDLGALFGTEDVGHVGIKAERGVSNSELEAIGEAANWHGQRQTLKTETGFLAGHSLFRFPPIRYFAFLCRASRCSHRTTLRPECWHNAGPGGRASRKTAQTVVVDGGVGSDRRGSGHAGSNPLVPGYPRQVHRPFPGRPQAQRPEQPRPALPLPRRRRVLEAAGGGWPPELMRYAAEAWRRNKAGEIDDEEMYCSDATWAGIYDRMHTHTVLETTRRLEIAADFGEVGMP